MWLDFFLILLTFSSFVTGTQFLATSFFQALLAYAIGVGFAYWFAWRRGWVQAYRQRRQEQARQARIAEKRARAEQADAATMPAQPRDRTDAGADGPRMTKYVIAVAKGEPWQPSRAVGLIQSLQGKLGPHHNLLLSIEATEEGIRWVLSSTAEGRPLSQSEVETMVRAYYPGAQVREYEPPQLSLPLRRRYMIFARSAINYFDPAQTATSIRKSDPLATIVQTMDGLRPGEHLHYDVSIPGLVEHSQEQIEQVLTMSAKEAGVRATGGVVRGQGLAWIIVASIINSAARWVYQLVSLNRQRVPRFSDADAAKHLQKLQTPLVMASVEVTFDTPDPARLSLFTAAVSAVKGLSSDETKLIEGYGSRELTLKTFEDWLHKTALNYVIAMAPESEDDVDETEQYTFYLTPDELAAFWHLPHKDFATEGIEWAARIPEQVIGDEADGAVVGTVGSGSSAQPVTINQVDRAYHTYITGQTGMGKSTLLHTIIHQDIARGHGVMVMDPHGSLIRDVVTTSIPPERQDDVVYLDVGDTAYPVPLNPLRIVGDASQESVFNTVMWIIKSIYAESWSATQMETTFRNILQVVLTDPDATPLDLSELAENPDYRRRILARAQGSAQLSRSAKNFWKRFEGLSPSKQQSMTQSTLNRLSAFLGAKPIERITCHPQALDFRRLIQEKKIVLVDLSGDAIVSEVDSLGAIFFAQAFLASLALGESPKNEPPRFYLFVDETQRFITTAMPDMFSEARKFGLSLTLANQYIGQLDTATRNGITNNVGTKVSFEASPEEAALTAKLYEPEVAADELTKLGVGRAAVRTRYEGQTLPGFVIQARQSPQADPGGADLEAIKRRSRERLGLITAEEVDRWLDARYESELFAPGGDDEVALQDFDTGSQDGAAGTSKAEAPDQDTTATDEV